MVWNNDYLTIEPCKYDINFAWSISISPPTPLQHCMDEISYEPINLITQKHKWSTKLVALYIVMVRKCLSFRCNFHYGQLLPYQTIFPRIYNVLNVAYVTFIVFYTSLTFKSSSPRQSNRYDIQENVSPWISSGHYISVLISKLIQTWNQNKYVVYLSIHMGDWILSNHAFFIWVNTKMRMWSMLEYDTKSCLSVA